jgi:exopolyphosphatase/guanosine-5'-triphosphate,3'-diphosphate pyrophosphatase
VRAAAIDVGSNAIRFLAAEVDESGQLESLLFDRAAVRLGRDVFEHGRIGDELMDAAVDALVRFRRRMDELGITQYRAVATSAVRDSANGTDLIARTRRAAGIALEVIDGTEEAELVVRAVRARVPMGREPWLLVDIGGGSVEVTLADARRTLKTASYPLGAVRLLEHYDAGDAAGARRVIEAQVDAIPLPDEAGRAVGGFVATGGNADALADLLELEPDDGATARLSLELLCETIERLAAASIEERLSWGLRPDRADVILPAAIVYQRLCTRARCDEIWIPRVGVREGVILDVAKHRSVAGTPDS